jgi:hypothetical protein
MIQIDWEHATFYFFLPTIFVTSIHFSGTPKLPSCSSTAGVCLPWTITSCKPPAMGETVQQHYIKKGLNLNPKKTVQYVPEVEDAQRTRSASARASPERRYCSNPVMNVHTLRPCLVLLATVIGRSVPFLVKGSSLPIAMRYQGCIRPHKALSASSRFANSGTETAPPFAFGEPYSAAEKTASELTLRYCCSTRLTSSCFATYARSADLTSARV